MTCGRSHRDSCFAFDGDWDMEEARPSTHRTLRRTMLFCFDRRGRSDDGTVLRQSLDDHDDDDDLAITVIMN